MVKFLSGQKVAEKIFQRLKREISVLKKKGIVPTLSVILVGKDKESLIFLREKKKRAEKLGIILKVVQFPKKTKEGEIIKKIRGLNEKKDIHGIVVQLPLPPHLQTERILKEISPEKDIDCLSSSLYPPPTAKGVLKLLSAYKIPIKKKKMVILGMGRLVGRPLSLLAKKAGAFVLTCRKGKDLSSKTKKADILVSATGSPGLIKKEMVKKKATVIDVAKDVEREVEKIASYITPKIGGVGPLTIALLFDNLIKAAKNVDNLRKV